MIILFKITLMTTLAPISPYLPSDSYLWQMLFRGETEKRRCQATAAFHVVRCRVAGRAAASRHGSNVRCPPLLVSQQHPSHQKLIIVHVLAYGQLVGHYFIHFCS